MCKAGLGGDLEQLNVVIGLDQKEFVGDKKRAAYRTERGVTVLVGQMSKVQKEVKVEEAIWEVQNLRFLEPGKRSRIGRPEVDALVTEKGKALDSEQRPTELYR
jgi:hypothetical protein